MNQLRHRVSVAACGAAFALCAAVAAAQSPAPTPPSARPAPTENRCQIARVELVDAIGSATAKPGDLFHFRTLDAVQLDAATVIPRATPGIGIVSLADHAKRGGVGGFVNLDARYLRLENGREIHTLMDRTGNGPTSSGKTNNVQGPFGFVPVLGMAMGAYGSLHRGSDITVPKGTVFDVFLGDEEVTSACATRSR